MVGGENADRPKQGAEHDQLSFERNNTGLRLCKAKERVDGDVVLSEVPVVPGEHTKHEIDDRPCLPGRAALPARQEHEEANRKYQDRATDQRNRPVAHEGPDLRIKKQIGGQRDMNAPEEENDFLDGNDNESRKGALTRDGHDAARRRKQERERKKGLRTGKGALDRLAKTRREPR